VPVNAVYLDEEIVRPMLLVTRLTSDVRQAIEVPGPYLGIVLPRVVVVEQPTPSDR
jgi:hypothetical protein